MHILAIAVHPDDETLGCGGTLLKHRAAGDELHWLVATQATEPQWPADVVQAKRLEVDRVAAAYGMKQVYRLGLSSTTLDSMPRTEIIETVRRVVAEVRPEVVYLIHGGDAHTDHHVIFEASLAVLKSFYMRKFGVRQIAAYETLSSTEAAPPLLSRAFIPNLYVDITPHVEQKLAIMDLYRSELQPPPLPRCADSLRALARYRGAAIGVEYAEAFMLMREIA